MATERRTNTVQYNGYVAGWLDSSVEDFLAALPRKTESAAYALITCLDSNRELSPRLKGKADLRVAMNGAATVFNKGLLFPSKLLHNASLRSQLFVGFDEIWFFPTDKIEPKPESVSIVGPNRINQRMLEKLGHWMEANECSLALGDGMGMNIIVKAHGLMKYVIAHSLSQPKPTFQMSQLWVQDEEKESSRAKPSKYRSIDDA